MKEKSSSQKESKHGTQDSQQVAAAGLDGAAVAPPTYGMDVLDQPVHSSVIQGKAAPNGSNTPPDGHPVNRTGLPDALKTGIEALSNMSLDDVRVHTNSPRPAQLNALAYAQGTDIHVAPGQERHLPHEAWHVVQQKQGRVKPTLQMKQGIQVNDDNGLEHEADIMGQRAQSLQHKSDCGCSACDGKLANRFAPKPHTSMAVAQLANCAHPAHAHLAVCPDEKKDEKKLVPLVSKKNQVEAYAPPSGDDLKFALLAIQNSKGLGGPAAASAESSAYVDRTPALTEVIPARDVYALTVKYTRIYTGKKSKAHPPHGSNFNEDRSVKQILDNIMAGVSAVGTRRAQVEAKMQETWSDYKRLE